ncbi:hypothetical protein N7499_007358 [Penicillium canescens]|uniref:Uncharacterized protein n=1 Tax=Penicillium canescens TaxID=5083 RepID=A0AAD6IFA3_PENCN|nr:uncharacterized protein N7446_003049 [Penicillium canescens]KAJ5996326.1 hypothetical protein N7522_007986 [Penicillium canescens]KAJ6044855.1 hypothetical protein N7460_006210 [Penicillium canescens]KAJ6056324.1 hypothetical protein N7444_005422 [Penicillium canescens]KAJ6075272.1 hypothetical protein N7446_003049 [Penicillium canescens]KAJ6082484.1 hypothetical protein N7499_007358 [Penicillium canescens]
MLGLWEGSPRSSSMLAILLAAAPVVLGLRTTAGSPCTDVCGTITNTTSSEISCLDQSYNTTSTGKDFEKCISCQLESDFHISATGESDVDWGLYNLRYAFSTCVFGYPDSISNTSSPCPVACDGVRPAVRTDIDDPSTSNLHSWCDDVSFADNVVNTCEFCYNLTTTQVYMANFLESIRYNCHFKTATGKTFDIAPSRIFTQSLLPSSLSLTTPTSGGSNVNLGVVIAVPIVGFLIILIALATCCFFFIRHRRKKARRTRQSPSMYNQWNDPALAAQYGDQQQGWANAGYGYGPGSGFGFVDNDGRGQELAYQGQQSKGGFSQGVFEQSDVQYQQQAYEQHQIYLQQQQQGHVPTTHVHDPDKKVPQQWE